MKTRILKVHLGKALRAELDKPNSKTKLAAKIGVSQNTLTAMLNDDWEYITREIIERTADYLQLELNEVFEFVPVKFWDPILETNQCKFLRGPQDEKAKANEKEVVIQRSDDNATDEVKGFLREYMSGFTFENHSRDEDELLNRARSENCIVIGSPKSNAATEILLSRFFNAEPFNSSEDNRRKIPFGFCWPDATKIVEQSSLTCSAFARKKTGGTAGIAVKGRGHVPADYLEMEKFRAWQTDSGRDCGLIFVANRPFGTDHNVKLIVLAGFSGLGTLGAARALIKDFRYLEPKPDEKCVYGVVQCLYSKTANSESRTLKNLSWKVCVGGGLTVQKKVANKKTR